MKVADVDRIVVAEEDNEQNIIRVYLDEEVAWTRRGGYFFLELDSTLGG